MKRVIISVFVILFVYNANAQFLQYPSEDNLIRPRMVKMFDDHLIFLSEEREYEANFVPIFGGKPYAHFLVKTDFQGNVIWTSKYLCEWLSYPYKFFPHEDGSLTTIGKVRNTFECLGMDDQFGIPQIEILHFNPDGSLEYRVQHPTECYKYYTDAVQNGDQYIVLSSAKDAFTNPGTESLTVFNQKGDIVFEKTFPGKYFFGAEMILDTNGELNIYNIDDNKVYHTLIDEDFKIINQKQLYNYDTISISKTRFGTLTTHNGDQVLYIPFYSDNMNQTDFFRLREGELIAQNRIENVYAINMVELENESFVATYAEDDIDTTENIGLVYLDRLGNKIKDTVIIETGDQRPTSMVALSEDKFVVAGDYNCCNKDSLIGSSNAFLWLSHPTISQNEDIEIPMDVTLYPNPVLNQLHLEIKNNFKFSKILIYNSSGQKIKSYPFQNNINIIDVNHLDSGIYFAKILLDDKILKSIKFVK